jgi:DNA-binding transcriptional regulator YdaS (Cro superfamily)
MKLLHQKRYKTYLDFALHRLGCTNVKLARLTGYSEAEISRWRSGIRQMSLFQCRIISEAVNLDPAKVAWGDWRNERR